MVREVRQQLGPVRMQILARWVHGLHETLLDQCPGLKSGRGLWTGLEMLNFLGLYQGFAIKGRVVVYKRIVKTYYGGKL